MFALRGLQLNKSRRIACTISSHFLSYAIANPAALSPPPALLRRRSAESVLATLDILSPTN